MATGDVKDIRDRLLSRNNLAPWFPFGDAVLVAILTGSATAFAFIYSAYKYAAAQTRLLTMSGMFLDLFAYDFFGSLFMRRQSETDMSFLPRIQKELFRRRNTRAGISQAINDLVGSPPTIVELWNPGDCGAYDIPQSLGYDVAGLWGSYDFPYQFLITVPEPVSPGIPNVTGYDDPQGGYDVGGMAEYYDPSQFVGLITQQMIYDTVNQNRSAGITAWVKINTQTGVNVVAVKPMAKWLITGFPL